LRVEAAPFRFEVHGKKGKYEIRTAAWGYFENLVGNILNLLDNLERLKILFCALI